MDDGVEAMTVPFGRYELLLYLASGGCGSVYLARSEAGLHAIKVLAPGVDIGHQEWLEFREEAHVASCIRHPNVVSVTDLIYLGEVKALAMDFVFGRSLQQIQKTAAILEAPLAEASVLHIVRSAARGLHAAHTCVDPMSKRRLDIVHRDISPANIMVSFDGPTQVVDFGIAHFKGRVSRTEKGILRGKVPYMSPEQLAGDTQALDHRSDIFSLGTVLWEALTGRALFRYKTFSPIAVAERIQKMEIPPPSAIRDLPFSNPTALDEVVLRALHRAPEARYATAEAFAEAIDELLESSDTVVTDETVRRELSTLFPSDDLRARLDEARRGEGCLDLLAERLSARPAADRCPFEDRMEDRGEPIPASDALEHTPPLHRPSIPVGTAPSVILSQTAPHDPRPPAPPAPGPDEEPLFNPFAPVRMRKDDYEKLLALEEARREALRAEILANLADPAGSARDTFDRNNVLGSRGLEPLPGPDTSDEPEPDTAAETKISTTYELPFAFEALVIALCFGAQLFIKKHETDPFAGHRSIPAHLLEVGPCLEFPGVYYHFCVSGPVQDRGSSGDPTDS